MSVWRELKRRDVFRVGAAYLLASWLVVQVIGVLIEPLSLPDALDTVVVVLLAIGFPFALVAAWIYEVTPEGIRVTGSDDGARRAVRTRQRLTSVVIGLLVLAVGLMALDDYLAPTSRGTGDVSRIAVLPCTDLSPDPTHSFFAAGMHAELVNRLGLLSGLEVTSQTSVMRYADGRTPIAQVADELGVPAVLECFVRYSGDRVLLTAQLIDGASDSGLWSQSYQADMADLNSLFQVQGEIGMNVANALHVAFLDAEREEVERPPTQSREAYELWLAALEENPAVGGGPRAIELLEQVLEIDPEFAEAWSTKSTAQSTMYIAYPDRETLLADALDAAERAIALAPHKSDGYLARAQVLHTRRDWLGAERDWQAASERDASVREPVLLLLSAGYLVRARDDVQESLDLDPLNPTLHYWLLLAHEMLGDTDAADAVYAQGQRLYATGPFWLGNVAIEWARLGRGETETGYEWRSWSGPLAEVPDPIGDPDGALALLKQVAAEVNSQTPVGLLQYAMWAAYFGDTEYALRLLDGAVLESGSGLLMQFVWLPVFDDVRQSPGFEDLLQNIGLVDYWQTAGWPDLCRPSERGFDCV